MVTDAKIRDAIIPQNSDLVKLPYFYSNVTSFFLTKFNQIITHFLLSLYREKGKIFLSRCKNTGHYFFRILIPNSIQLTCGLLKIGTLHRNLSTIFLNLLKIKNISDR